MCKFRTALFCLLALVALCIPHPARAGGPANFDLANHRYETGDFAGARSAYQALVDSGNYSANLFYNLGNADYRLGKKGDAFVAYERALALNPSHPEARANLNLLRDETGARPATLSWFERVFSWPDDSTQSRTAWLAAVAFWVLCLSLSPLLLKRQPALLTASLSVLTLGWCAVALALASCRGEIWIVKETQVPARVAPADGSKLAATLPMGSHVRLLLERGPWLYVMLPGQDQDARGWIARSALEPVTMRKS